MPRQWIHGQTWPGTRQTIDDNDVVQGQSLFDGDDGCRRLLHQIGRIDFLLVLTSVRSHHELLDGKGDPDGLDAPQIDDLTRILTVCDVYAALIERRSYKPARSPAQAMIVMDAMASAGKLETSLVRELGRIMLAPRAAA